MRDIIFIKKLSGNQFKFMKTAEKNDVVRIIDVTHINDFEQRILQLGGNFTVPTVELKGNQKIAYFSDPDGCIFALLEHDR